MPDQFLVAVALTIAACSVVLSPMPLRVRVLVSLSFALVGWVYLADAVNLLTMANKAIILRYSLIVLSSVITITIAAWQVERRKWRK